jgi:hydrogenase-1 operon protein HyaF
MDAPEPAVPPAPEEPAATAVAVPLLHEIRHALARLAESGEPTALDLQSIPMGPGDDDRLFAALGEGEVKAEVHALGRSTVTETAYAGVWLVEHYNAHDQSVGRFIEVTTCPEILKSHPTDVGEGLARLEQHLAQG